MASKFVKKTEKSDLYRFIATLNLYIYLEMRTDYFMGASFLSYLENIL